MSEASLDGLVAFGDLEAWANSRRDAGQSVVFTNGCFDLLHPGHLDLLSDAGRLGDVLIVAINDDDSVTRLKGDGRPIYPALERAEILLGLRWVDFVTVFSEDTPLETIERIRPAALVKGAEYGAGEIVGERFVKSYGGTVKRFPMKPGFATTHIVRQIREGQ